MDPVRTTMVCTKNATRTLHAWGEATGGRSSPRPSSNSFGLRFKREEKPLVGSESDLQANLFCRWGNGHGRKQQCLVPH